jgi:hypothetical protein
MSLGQNESTTALMLHVGNAMQAKSSVRQRGRSVDAVEMPQNQLNAYTPSETARYLYQRGKLAFLYLIKT